MEVLKGSDFREAFLEATRCLESYRDSINALNVFPVPDGDTGTNMLLTLRSALAGCMDGANPAVFDITGGLADGAFWGARGNSGVILSQFFRGFADALEGAETCDAGGIARAFDLASQCVYRAVGQPVEGTMLTVIGTASAAVQQRLAAEEEDPRSLWGTAFNAATDALYLTPSQLPILQEAGVVDAGAMGVVVIIGAALSSLGGLDRATLDDALAPALVIPDSKATEGVSDDSLDSIGGMAWGYCTQFVIGGQSLDPDGIRECLTDEESSAVVVGDDRHVRVHLHTQDPGTALSYGVTLGELTGIKIENMDQQNQEFLAGHADQQQKTGPLALVAVASGAGMSCLFYGFGCAKVVRGGPTMNPSVGQILSAVSAANAEHTIVLPNDANVVATAEQAKRIDPGLRVVPSKTMPQGVSALLAYNPEESLSHNLASMTEAMQGVVTIEVTQAVRPVTIGGVSVGIGTYIGLLQGDLVTSGDTPEEALEGALEQVAPESDMVVTIYFGHDVQPAAAEAAGNSIGGLVPGIQVDVVNGGQPHYHYLASVE
jgi:DAK2 domain fusion protein YloV